MLTTEQKEKILALAGLNIVGSGVWWRADMQHRQPKPGEHWTNNSVTKFLMGEIATTARTKEESINKTWIYYLGEPT